MSKEDRMKVVCRQAEAWKKVGTVASCCGMTTGKMRDTYVQELLDLIEKEKRAISRLIDSLPD